jgi:hypothetical protein
MHYMWDNSGVKVNCSYEFVALQYNNEEVNSTINTASKAYIAILDGCNKNDLGLLYVGIFGQNIGAASPLCIQNHTFHVECLQACSTPPYGPPRPKGTLAYIFSTPPGFPAGSCPLVIY